MNGDVSELAQHLSAYFTSNCTPTDNWEGENARFHRSSIMWLIHECEELGRYVCAVFSSTPSADVQLSTGWHAWFRIIGSLSLFAVIQESCILLVTMALLNSSVGGVSRNAASYQPEGLHLLTDYGIWKWAYHDVFFAGTAFSQVETNISYYMLAYITVTKHCKEQKLHFFSPLELCVIFLFCHYVCFL